MSKLQSSAVGVGLFSLVILAVVVWRWWTWLPAVEHANLRYVQLMATALSSQEEGQLARVEQAIQQKVAAGEMTPLEQKYLLRLADQARGGDWDGARRECFRLAEAQLSRSREPVTMEHFHTHKYVRRPHTH